MVAPGDRRFVGVDGAGVTALTVFWFGVCVLLSRGQSYQSVAVGRYRRVAVPAPLASGTVCLETFGYGRDGTDFVAMGVVDCRVDWCRLGCNLARENIAKVNTGITLCGFFGIITP